MNYIDICTGLSAVTVAWHELGWKPLCFAEIEPFPCRVLRHHHPNVPNHGDFTTMEGNEYGAAADILVGGTPCQDFSVAGLRKGMDGARSQLTIEYARLAHRARPRWLVWENVPGVLSIDGGAAFALFLSALCGRTVSVPEDGWRNSGVVAGAAGAYGLAYGVLDAQHFGVPQRRRRVFVVGYLGDWRRAAAVLFERESLSGHPAPGAAKRQRPAAATASGPRERRFWKALAAACGLGATGGSVARIAPTVPARTKGGGGLGTDFDCDGGLLAFGGNNTTGPIDIATSQDAENQLLVPVRRGVGIAELARQAYAADAKHRDLRSPMAFRACGQDGLTPSHISPPVTSTDGGGAGVPTIAYRTAGDGCVYEEGDRTAPLTTATDPNTNIIAFDTTQITSVTCRSNPQPGEPSLRSASGGSSRSYIAAMAVRRLTPRECERLQGFPDDYTRIPGLKSWRALDETETPEELRSLGLEVRQSGKTGEWRVNDPDGPRYKAIGNSMAAPVMRWIGERIQMVEAVVGEAVAKQP